MKVSNVSCSDVSVASISNVSIATSREYFSMSNVLLSPLKPHPWSQSCENAQLPNYLNSHPFYSHLM